MAGGTWRVPLRNGESAGDAAVDFAKEVIGCAGQDGAEIDELSEGEGAATPGTGGQFFGELPEESCAAAFAAADDGAGPATVEVAKDAVSKVAIAPELSAQRSLLLSGKDGCGTWQIPMGLTISDWEGTMYTGRTRTCLD
jgi:hypothetical protein